MLWGGLIILTYRLYGFFGVSLRVDVFIVSDVA